MNLKNPIQLLIVLICCYPLTGYSQTRSVSGFVYSAETGQPIPGTSVKSKHSGRAAITDNVGYFAFQNASHLDTLLISSLGYHSKELPLKQMIQKPINIYLDSFSNLMEEVVINTGYQSVPRDRATGSFSQIDRSLINRSVSNDIISRLEGITNGLSYEMPLTATNREPSTKPNLRIRGLSTIDGETAPLIVLDNFPYEGDIENINPNDVESVTVLKDAAAASIWGARAGNGVIVITTKGGVSRNKSVLTLNSNLSITDKPDLYYNREILPSNELVELEKMRFARGVYSKNDWTAFTPVVETLFALEEGKIDAATAERVLDDFKQYDIRHEALEYLYRRSVAQQYSVSIDGGSSAHRYYLSAGFDDVAGGLIGNGHKRTTLNIRNDFIPIAGININTSVNYVKRNVSNNGVSITELAPTGLADVYTYARLVDGAGSAMALVKNNRLTYTDSAPEMGLLDWHYRPLEELMINDNTSEQEEVRLNTGVRYQLWKDFGIEARYQYQRIDASSRILYNQDSYYARNLINRYTQPDGTRPIPLGGILDRNGNTFTSHYGRLQADYNRTWNEMHVLTGLAGFEIRHEHSMGSGASRLYGYDDDVLTHVTDLDFDSSVPLLPRSSGTVPYGNSTGSQTTDRFVSYYANLAHTYRNKYILSASARWDASNIFGVEFNQKGVPLWSVGAAWNVNRESFLDVNWVSLLKLRTTYGANGNAVRTLSSLPFVRFGAGSVNAASRVLAAQVMSVGNPDLSWEQVNTINVGMDFSLFRKQRISGSVEWYRKWSKNLIGYDLIDPTTGVIASGLGSLYNLDNRRNYADMQTTGIDVELTTVNLDREFRWHTTFLFSHVANKVTNYHTPQNPSTTDFLGQFGIPIVEGTSPDQLYALPWHGLDDTGSPLVNVNGVLGTDYDTYFNTLGYADLQKVGTSTPTYFGAVRNTLSWRSFTASINILWKSGYNVMRESVIYRGLLGATQVTHLDYLHRWQKPGDERVTNVPSLPESINTRRDDAYRFSEALIERGDHIRLHDINISYELPQRYVGRIGISQIRVFAYAKNLGVLWKYTDLDIDPGIRALYPQPLQISLGLQIQL